MAVLKSALRWTGRALGAGLIGLIAIGGFGQISAMGDEPSFDMVEVEPGRRLHVECEGEPEAPFALYDAGAFGIYSDGWWIKEELKRDFRVCLYDRAGMGWSDPVPAGVSPSPDWHVEDMRRLARAVGAAPPYYLIGHSMSGLRLHAFASLHLDELAGLVFIDAARPAGFTGESARRLMNRFSGAMSAGVFAAQVGLARVAAQVLPDSLDLPRGPARDKRRSIASVRHHKASREEVRAVDTNAEWLTRELAQEVPVSVFATSADGGRNAAVAEAARAISGFGRVHGLPDENHVSLLSRKIAPLIAEDVRAMAAFRAARTGPG
ncbi:alpha/beta fold hydrolase [bacterium]|nr:alpha/beta fold hydrolase [bacterium]